MRQLGESSIVASIEVRLPQWGMGMNEATLAEWLKQEGDIVAEDDEIATAEADKAVQVIIAPASGRLAKIFVREGETAEVETLLAIIETEN